MSILSKKVDQFGTDADVSESLKIENQKVLNTIEEKYTDATLRFGEQYASTVEPLTADGEKSLSRKLYLNVLLSICAVNLTLFISLVMLRYTRSC